MTQANIVDRDGSKKKGLIMDQCKWKQLENIITAKEREAMKAQQRIDYVLERKQLSAQMQEQWDNTFINIRKKRSEEMEARKLLIDAERERNFWQLKKEEQEIKDEIIRRARYGLSQERDCTKNINRALSLAETLRERRAQVEFKNKLREKEFEREMEHARSIWSDAEKYKKEEYEKFHAGGVVRQKLKIEKETMLKEAQEAKLKQELENKEEGQKELKRIQKEIKEKEQEELEKRKEQRELAIRNIQENIKMKEEYKKKMQLIEEEENMRIRIISEAKRRLNKERKEREKKAQEASIVRREKIARDVAAIVSDDTDHENRIIQQAEERQLTLENDRAKRDKDKVTQMKKERIEEYQVYLMNEQKRKQHDYEIAKWEMLQRFKKEEANRKFDNTLMEQRREAIKNCRIQWNQQRKERLERDQRDIEADVDAINRALQIWHEEDQECLCYGQQLIEECKKVGRPTYPLEAVLHKFKKAIGQLPQRPLSATWKSNIPIFNPAVEEEAKRREANRPKVQPRCGCIPRDGLHYD